MGTWGYGIFENDYSCDWLNRFVKCPDLSIIQNSIDAVFKEEYVGGYTSYLALAAIDTLARLKGNYGATSGFTEELDLWVSKNPMDPPKELIEKGLEAIKLILGQSSEILTLFNDDDGLRAWRIEVEVLRLRLLID